MVGDPARARQEERQAEADERQPVFSQRLPDFGGRSVSRQFGRLQFQNEQGHRHREDAVTQHLQAPFAEPRLMVAHRDGPGRCR
jgi:hypothetical protein